MPDLQILQKSLAYAESDLARNDPELRKQFRAAAIQAFEFTYEVAVRMLRRQLEQIVAVPAELREMPFMELIRTGADAGLVRDVAAFRVYREMRNITSHAYDESKAEQVFSALRPFVADVRFLLNELRHRNDAGD